MMSRTKAIGMVAVFAALSAGQVHAQEGGDTEKVCMDLASAKVAFEDVEKINADSTVDEAKQTVKRADKALDELSKSAKKARPEQYKELETAHKDLRKTVNDVPKDATLGQVRAEVTAGKERVRAAYNRLAQSINCA